MKLSGIPRSGSWLLVLLPWCTAVFGQTAHEKSRFAIIDPQYSPSKLMPATNLKTGGATWLYGPAELESWRLQILREKTVTAKLQVGYPGTFHTAYSRTSFRLKLDNQVLSGKVHFQAVGKGSVYINDLLLFRFNDSDSARTFILSGNKSPGELRFDLSTAAEPPALLILDGPFSTQNQDWEWTAEGEKWQPAFHFAQTKSGIPPHRLESSAVVLKPVSKQDDLYDFGREIFGFVTIRNPERPKISVGESTWEALDTLNKDLEQSLEMISDDPGRWRSKSPLAFRYLLTDVRNSKEIQCNALFYPVCYQGAFACSDPILTRIWMNSAYTLRLCMHDFLIDGVKRDRLPWAGDLAMSMMADAYAFGDPEIVRRSLTVLGRAGISKTDINGIIDYSLWWIIAQDHYQLYFGDAAHLKREWPRIRETLDQLKSRCNPSGFISPEKTWLFIDWVKQEKWTALQILWWWAQQSGAKLADRAGERQLAEYWKNSALSLKGNLKKTSWSDRKQAWLANPEFPEIITRHANFLAVISGIADENQLDGIGKLLSDDQTIAVGTPYMAGFENMAIARLGDIPSMITRTKASWGGMLSQGATTFWEAYDSGQQGSEQYSFYGRPYAKSLCHAWSAGPAAFLPAGILGLKPLEDGWKRFSVHPDIGTLQWICATVPTPYGRINLDINGNKATLTVPDGTIAEWNGEQLAGPQKITRTLAH
ncbi:MAG: alpha-L-rhamnosidase C-terminal domain-containing protein [Bacteroidales bacterium]|jgi:hypothetical protein